jgi:hypothetical protein
MFLRAADAIPAEHWMAKHCAEGWCAAEVVGHLVTVEETIVDKAGRVIEKTPKKFASWERLHVPMWFARVRLLRLKSPIPIDAAMLGAKENMLGQLRQTRERALSLLAKTQNRDLNAYRWKHPFLGSLNFYEWFELIAAHQVRHTKQIKEITERLPKVV